MRRLYSLLMSLAAPVAFLAVLARGLGNRAYLAAPAERFGFGRWIDRPSIWLHGVSVGEVSAAAALVRALRARHPAMPCVLSTATPTGRDRAQTLFGSEVDIRYLAYDTPGSVRRFLARVNPRIAIILETELWPNLLRECRRRSVPVVLASARLTARSVARYRRAGDLFADAIAENVTVAAQTAEDAERFIAIGADPARVREVGNVKFDMQLGESVLSAGRTLRADYLRARPVWTAGSTHAGEEEELLAAHAELRRSVPTALLVLVPRHPQRFESVAAALARRGVPFDRRSAAAPVRPEAETLLVDTMGELTAFYAAADVAFVGGSLVPVGGHNLLEPAALGVPVITGPYTANSKEIARELLLRGGAVQVADAAMLAGVLSQFFGDAALRRRAGSFGREFVEAHRGTVARLMSLIDPLLGPGRAPLKG
jgi:3-deoxy-D-manno-octulosonic-acid transferase